LRIRNIILLSMSLILILSCIGFQWVYASDYPRLVTDDEIKKYYGKIVDQSTLRKILELLEKSIQAMDLVS